MPGRQAEAKFARHDIERDERHEDGLFPGEAESQPLQGSSLGHAAVEGCRSYATDGDGASDGLREMTPASPRSRLATTFESRYVRRGPFTNFETVSKAPSS
jgi:hypothetical protein